SKVLSDHEKAKQILFIAFDWNTIVATKKQFPKNKCYWLSASRAEVLGKLNELTQNHLDGLDLRSNILDKELMTAIESQPLEVLAWTVDDPAEARRIIELGVHKITTNRPAALKLEMRKAGKD
ncbi:MAG: hypothetical protein LWW85_04525, partial [Marinilabiliales bacterium]|nr:hypothetical protein [Marinilabiliales bacterium]